MTKNELVSLFHTMTIEEIGDLKRAAEEYISMWFGFSKEVRAKRTPEWIAAAAKRLEGQFSICCECSEDYPAKEHELDGEIFCSKCRAEYAERDAKRGKR